MLVTRFSLLSLVAVAAVSCGGNTVKDNNNEMSVSADTVDIVLKSNDRLTMSTAWDYYPQSADMVSVTLQSDDMNAFDSSGDYSIGMINDSVLTGIDVISGVSFSKICENKSAYNQSVSLSLSKRLDPGKYVVTRTGDGNDTLRSAFNVVTAKDVNNMLRNYFSESSGKNDTIVANVYSYGIMADDTVGVDLRHDSPYMRELFYREVVSYSKLYFTGQTSPHIYTGEIVTDTLGVTMTTLEPVYPDTVSEIKFILHNNSDKVLCYGTPYKVARLVNGRWEELYQNSVWNMPLYLLEPDSDSEVMTARLRRPINNIGSGEYLIYKDVYFDGDREDSWNISARFSIM